MTTIVWKKYKKINGEWIHGDSNKSNIKNKLDFRVQLRRLKSSLIRLEVWNPKGKLPSESTSCTIVAKIHSGENLCGWAKKKKKNYSLWTDSFLCNIEGNVSSYFNDKYRFAYHLFNCHY